jgi:hypothetical protein
LGPIDRVSPYLFTPAAQKIGYVNQPQHQPSARIKPDVKNIKVLHTHETWHLCQWVIEWPMSIKSVYFQHISHQQGDKFSVWYHIKTVISHNLHWMELWFSNFSYNNGNSDERCPSWVD